MSDPALMLSGIGEAALRYGLSEWSVIPLHNAVNGACSCGKADACSSPAKHPRTPNGLKDATTALGVIRDWWTRWPNANIGLLTGVAFDVLDIDGEIGRANLKQALETQGVELPSGPRTKTGGGGSHILFTPTGGGNRAGILPKIDWRGANGYIVAPPSMHISGHRYEWRTDADLTIPEAPPWLFDMVAPAHPDAAVGTAKPLPAGIADGTPYGLQALEAEIGELRRTTQGGRNHALNAATYYLYQLVTGGELEARVVEYQLRATATAIGLSDHELTQTIASGRAAGLAKPRNAPELKMLYGGRAATTNVDTDPAAPQGDEEQPLSVGINPIDWATFWAHDGPEEEWLIEPLVPAGRQVALFATAKAGKSLLALEVAVAIATGQAVLDSPAREPADVVYIDQEMTEDDLRERLIDLGYDIDTDLTHLHYYQLEAIPPLDGVLGGLILEEIVLKHHAVVVVLDTMARVVAGDENDSDTYRNFYRSTGWRLKAAGVALLRLDHGGKHIEKGQRGSSAKADDVDVVFQLTADADNVTLKRTHSRVPWVPFEVKMTRQVEPYLKHVLNPGLYPAGTNDTAALLDQLNVPIDATVKTATAELRKSGNGKRTTLITAALKYRRVRRETPSGKPTTIEAETEEDE